MFEIQSIFLLPCIVLLATVATYPFICPSPAHWHLRSSILECQSDVHYTCLFNNSDDSYVEKCRKPGDVDVIRKGYKLIWSGSLNQGDCSFDRFQPINFRTNGSSSCIYLKSSCNEEGQVLANNGSGLKDAYCSCDSTRGYNFLHMPRSKDFCIPSEEDCTCYTNGSMPINNVDRTGFRLDNTPIGSSTSNGDKIRKLIVKDRRIVMYLALALLLSLGPVILILYLLPLWRRQIILCIRHTQGVIRECCRAEQSSNGASTDDLVSKDEGTTNDIQEFEQHPKLQNRSSIEQPKNTDVDGTTNPKFEMDNDSPKPDSTTEKEHFTVVTEVQAPAKSDQTTHGYSPLDDMKETKDGEPQNTINRSLEVDVHTDQDGYSVEGESIQEGNMGSDTKYETQMDNDSPKPDSTSEEEHFTVVTEVQAPAKSGGSIQEHNAASDSNYLDRENIVNLGEKKRGNQVIPKLGRLSQADGKEDTVQIGKMNSKEDQERNLKHLSKEEANMDNEFQNRQMNRRKYWEDIDKSYHETTFIPNIWDTIKGTNCESILIIGPDSYGKSVTAAHFGFRFEKIGYELYFLSLPDEVNKTLRVNKQQVFVIHKPLGIIDNKKDLEKWEDLSKRINKTTEKCNTKIIMTLSTRLFKMFEIRLRNTIFGGPNKVVDLSDENYCLSENDKRCILTIHKKKGNFQNDERFDNKVLNEPNISHFFVWCNLISNKQNETVVTVMKEETNLNDFYRKGIETLQQYNPNQFGSLVLAVLYDGTFDINELSECFMGCSSSPTEQEKKSREKVLDIFLSCGIPFQSEKIIVYQTCFDILNGTYFKKLPTASEYNIIDDVVTRAVIEIYGPKNLKIILKHASSSFIKKFVRSCKFPDQVERCIIVVTEKWQQRFAKRLMDDLRHGQISNVFKNPSFQDKLFVSYFCKELAELDSEALMSFMVKEQNPCHIKNPTPTADSPSLDEVIEWSTPLHWVCSLGLEEILKTVWDKCNKSQEFFKNIPGKLSPLCFAAGYGHLSVVKFLIEEMHVNIRDCQPQARRHLTPLYYAEQNRCSDVEKYLCNKEAYVKDVSFHSPRLGRKSATWNGEV